MNATAAPSNDERTWGMYAHLSGMLAFTAVPFGGLIGPLVLYLQNKSVRPFAAEQAREALNFHITAGIVQLVAVAVIIAGWISLVVSTIGLPKDAAPSLSSAGTLIAAIVLYLLVYVWTFIFTLIATIRASAGHLYRYPFTIRFVR